MRADNSVHGSTLLTKFSGYFIFKLFTSVFESALLFKFRLLGQESPCHPRREPGTAIAIKR